MAFTVFDNFADVYNDFDESDPQEVEERRLLADAIMSYGLNGTVPELPKGVRRIFMALKDAIDNSKDARAKGGKGGRPRKTKVPETPKPKAVEGDAEVPASDEPQRSETGNLGYENPETVVSENGNLGFEKEKPRFPENGNPNLTCPELSCTELSCAGEVRAPDAPGAPTLDEAVAYFETNCLGGDPKAFFDFYASQGWMKSNGRRGRPRRRWPSRSAGGHRSIRTSTRQMSRPRGERPLIGPSSCCTGTRRGCWPPAPRARGGRHELGRRDWREHGQTEGGREPRGGVAMRRFRMALRALAVAAIVAAACLATCAVGLYGGFSLGMALRGWLPW